ncbi:MAG TPA: outer-membrane lipoprotein carrier protein LolA [Spirochaetota bacterium]|nr:outer-membrane lipoprotein carrier protein LolA [Spirochaetota bacterium]HOL57371.1 outer-membrane lipoprotein carrier protein LolA [Spirochaetota bacterium]
MKKNISILFWALFCGVLSFSQDELLSAKDLLQKFSDNFKKNVKDYEADIKWYQDDNIQSGKIYFKNPQKLRINFTDPNKQVICTNGYTLWVFIDYLNLTLKQEILQKEKSKTEEGKTESVVNPILINPMGYDKFLSNYSIEYYEGKTKTQYKDGKMVYKMKLIRWRSSKYGFNSLIITIEDNGLIRRIEGVTAAMRKIVLEIDNIKLNTGIGDSFFNYQPPSYANTIENFITTYGE